MAGERSPDDPEVARAAAQNDEFGAALTELRSLADRLDADAASEREAVAQALRADSPIDGRVVAATIARLAAERPSGRGSGWSRRRWLGGTIAAAAAALLSVWALGGFGGSAGGGGVNVPNDDEQRLGDEELTLASKPTEGGGYQLSWRCAVPVDGFRVTLYDPARPGEPDAERDVSGELPPDVTTWTIERSALAGLPPGLRWRVTAYLRSGQLRSSSSLR
ncbi:MAG: hypothetical protein KDE27_03765 [Planctomycetes bacterium]|nr:hypothetical protein [Planctomycetota bacterium]